PPRPQFPMARSAGPLPDIVVLWTYTTPRFWIPTAPSVLVPVALIVESATSTGVEDGYVPDTPICSPFKPAPVPLTVTWSMIPGALTEIPTAPIKFTVTCRKRQEIPVSNRTP